MKNTLKIIVLLISLMTVGGLAAQNELQADATKTPGFDNPDRITITTVYPNPATDQIMIEFMAPGMGDEVLLRIKNEEGKLVLWRNLVTIEGCNMVILNVGELPVGEYVVVLDEGRRQRSARWQKM